MLAFFFYPCILNISESTLIVTGDEVMDKTDKKLLKLFRGDARMSYQELGDKLGMSRVAAKKRVNKLEEAGIIRGYNTCIYEEGEVTMIFDIVTTPEAFEEILEYLGTRTVNVRQIYTTTKENHIHMVAVSTDVNSLTYMANHIQKKFGDRISEYHCHAVKDIVKDVYGGVDYDQRAKEKPDGTDEPDGGSNA